MAVQGVERKAHNEELEGELAMWAVPWCGVGGKGRKALSVSVGCG